jgi:hypothetical protein
VLRAPAKIRHHAIAGDYVGFSVRGQHCRYVTLGRGQISVAKRRNRRRKHNGRTLPGRVVMLLTVFAA